MQKQPSKNYHKEKDHTLEDQGIIFRSQIGARILLSSLSLVVNKHLDTAATDTRLIETLETKPIGDTTSLASTVREIRTSSQDYIIEDLWTIDIDSESESEEDDEIMSDQTNVTT